MVPFARMPGLVIQPESWFELGNPNLETVCIDLAYRWPGGDSPLFTSGDDERGSPPDHRARFTSWFLRLLHRGGAEYWFDPASPAWATPGSSIAAASHPPRCPTGSADWSPPSARCSDEDSTTGPSPTAWGSPEATSRRSSATSSMPRPIMRRQGPSHCRMRRGVEDAPHERSPTVRLRRIDAPYTDYMDSYCVEIVAFLLPRVIVKPPFTLIGVPAASSKLS